MAEADPRKTFNVHDAKSNLSRLMDRARAGEEIVLAKAGEPWAKLVRVDRTEPIRRKPGGWPAARDLPLEVWSEPLSEEELAAIDDRPEQERH
ncbi:type II toxin-antitoxin system Phd/YefM family antitoxin [Sphingomonas sp.]|uniref:type II toxin-antitoxin system Phd/YefM family antitoxin n=1 Tax=Sphingomonas sp. TaxID=28214 RepID=UPI003CC5C2CA